MISQNSLRLRIIKTFCLFGLILSLLYGIFVYFGLEYLEDYLETNLYRKRIQNELNLFLQQYSQNKHIPLPRSSFFNIYLSESDMPESLRSMMANRSDGFYEADELSTGKEIEYNFIIHTIPETRQKVYVLYDTSFLEINEQRISAIILILASGLIIVFFVSIWIGIATSRKVIAPVTDLSDLIKQTDPDHLPTDLSAFYEYEEVGTLASALEQAMQRIELFNKREQQFTRNASHELRTPVTIIKGRGIIKRCPGITTTVC